MLYKLLEPNVVKPHEVKQLSRELIVGIDMTIKPNERRLIGNICQLSCARARTKKASQLITTFKIVELSKYAYADIILINGHSSIEQQTQWIQTAQQDDIPVIFIGPHPTEVQLKHFFSVLPIRLGAKLLRALDDAAEIIPMPSCHVLVIDDSELVRSLMGMILESKNISVSYAEDGTSGVLKAKAKPFDLIFLDVMMPGIDGYDICKVLKKDERTANTPVVMLTSKGSPFNKIKGAMVGCDRYLTKPVDEERIVATLKMFGLGNFNK